jgi:hypothetical protein
MRTLEAPFSIRDSGAIFTLEMVLKRRKFPLQRAGGCKCVMGVPRV